MLSISYHLLQGVDKPDLDERGCLYTFEVNPNNPCEPKELGGGDGRGEGTASGLVVSVHQEPDAESPVIENFTSGQIIEVVGTFNNAINPSGKAEEWLAVICSASSGHGVTRGWVKRRTGKREHIVALLEQGL